MKITADTNVLVRAMTGEDAQQSRRAQAELANADVVALTLPAPCELVWVLSQGYKSLRMTSRKPSGAWSTPRMSS